MTTPDTPAHTPLPCPFCGSDHLTVCEIVGRGYTFECEGCHIEGPLAKDGPSLLERWNTRACNSHYQLVEAVERLLNMPGDIDTECNPPEMQQRVLKERLEAWSFARAALSQAGGASE